MPSVAIIGASSDRSKYGNKAVRAYQRQRWTVYPVNPRESTVEGLKSYAAIGDIPGEVDRATLYVPPAIGTSLLPEIKQKGVRELYVNPGAGSDELIAEAERLGLDPIEACSIVEIGERP